MLQNTLLHVGSLMDAKEQWKPIGLQFGTIGLAEVARKTIHSQVQIARKLVTKLLEQKELSDLGLNKNLVKTSCAYLIIFLMTFSLFAIKACFL